MNELAYKAFVLDIDGTICDYDGLLNTEAVHSIRWLRSLGYEVILSSGRGPWDTFYLGVFIGCTKVAVCENGGVLMTGPSDLKIYSDKTPSLTAFDLLSKNFEVKIKPVSARLTEVVLLRTFDLEKGQALIDQARIPVTINDSRFAFHLTKKGINKALALVEGLRFLDVRPEEAIVIGDSETDVPMFESCGYSIAVANASDDIKSKVKYVASQPMGDGVVEAIEYCQEKLLKT